MGFKFVNIQCKGEVGISLCSRSLGKLPNLAPSGVENKYPWKLTTKG